METYLVEIPGTISCSHETLGSAIGMMVEHIINECKDKDNVSITFILVKTQE